MYELKERKLEIKVKPERPVKLKSMRLFIFAAELSCCCTDDYVMHLNSCYVLVVVQLVQYVRLTIGKII